MSYIANQYNYATPLSSAANLTNDSAAVLDLKYFTLFDNTLDGTSVPISDDVGIWGTSLSDDNGVLPEPFVITVTENLNIHTFRLVGSRDSYPVAFTVNFFNDAIAAYTITETANDKYEYYFSFPKRLTITGYTIRITKISQPNAVARIYRAYGSYEAHKSITNYIKAAEVSKLYMDAYLESADALSVRASESSDCRVVIKRNDIMPLSVSETDSGTFNTLASDILRIGYADSTLLNKFFDISESLPLKLVERSSITNIIDVTKDSIKTRVVSEVSHPQVTAVGQDECECLTIDALLSSGLANIHTAMKATERRIYGKVYVTYTDPLSEQSTPTIESSEEAHSSELSQVTDGNSASDRLFFTLYENDLSGAYHPSDETSQVGWSSRSLSNADGTFDEPPYILLAFAAKPITDFTVFFDNMRDCVVEDFKVDFINTHNEATTIYVTGNADTKVIITPEHMLVDIMSIRITVFKVSKSFYPAVILDTPVASTFLYVGYQDTSDLISIDLLEELTYEDDVEALGGVSANEVTIKFDNSNKYFNIDNILSPVAHQLRRNRKIEPYLGVEIIPGEIEWYSLGKFWSYSWDVPYDNLTASVIGFDTIGLLDTTSYTNHNVLIDKSIGEVAEYILNDAKQQLTTLEWYIAPELYDVVIPYAWFDAKSHTAALRKLSLSYPMHIYCDRDGKICVMPQKLHLDYYYDTWSDSTNVIRKTYSSLYTVLPNIINVTAINPFIEFKSDLIQDAKVYTIDGPTEVILNFTYPYVSGIEVSVDKDAGVSYTYNVYSWGIELTFTGTGTVRSISCTGNILNTINTTVYTKRNAESIRVNGAITRDVHSDFIQTSTMANIIIDRLFELSKQDIYDAEVEYRGDISLTINDPILLLDGLAPDNRYNIKRHQLYWDGSLTGTANLNT